MTSATRSSLTSADFTAAAESNLMEKSLSLARLPGGEIHTGNRVWFITGSRLAGHNGVVRAEFTPADVDECIKAALQPFRARGLPLTWWTGPSTCPTNLGARLQAHGFVHNRDMIGMAAEFNDLRPPYPLPEIKIEPVLDAAALTEWHPVYMAGFNTPQSVAKDSLAAMQRELDYPASGLSHYLVRKAGRIIATSSLFINDHIAGLYNLTTIPEERGSGIGAALTLGTYAIAHDLGCNIVTLQTTYPNALRLYHRLGFEVYCKFGIYQMVK